METDLRASLIASGVAALLSLLVGLVSGVGALALFLRALGGGVAMGALMYGALFLLRRFIPELFESSGESLPFTGTSVDIVLPGDLPEGSEGMAAPGDTGEALAPPPAASRQTSRGRKPRDTTDLVEDVEDLGYEAETLLEDSGPAEESAAPAPPSSPRGSGGFDDLDVLPDLEALSGGFTPAAPEAAGEVSRDFDEAPLPRSQGGRSSDADPTVLAQAVRTLLKRDQER